MARTADSNTTINGIMITTAITIAGTTKLFGFRLLPERRATSSAASGWPPCYEAADAANQKRQPEKHEQMGFAKGSSSEAPARNGRMLEIGRCPPGGFAWEFADCL
jgi:hypothetical protein